MFSGQEQYSVDFQIDGAFQWKLICSSIEVSIIKTFFLRPINHRKPCQHCNRKQWKPIFTRGIVQEFVWQMGILSLLMFGMPLKRNAISCSLWMNEQMIVLCCAGRVFSEKEAHEIHLFLSLASATWYQIVLYILKQNLGGKKILDFCFSCRYRSTCFRKTRTTAANLCRPQLH